MSKSSIVLTSLESYGHQESLENQGIILCFRLNCLFLDHVVRNVPESHWCCHCPLWSMSTKGHADAWGLGCQLCPVAGCGDSLIALHDNYEDSHHGEFCLEEVLVCHPVFVSIYSWVEYKKLQQRQAFLKEECPPMSTLGANSVTLLYKCIGM